MNSFLLSCAAILVFISDARSEEQRNYKVAKLTSSGKVNLRRSSGLNNKPIGGFIPNSDGISVVGKAVSRDGIQWVPVEFFSLKGWMDRRFLIKDSEHSEASEFHVYSPSGRTTVREVLRSGMEIRVFADRRKTQSYGIHHSVSAGAVDVFFSDDESILAFADGTPSMGNDVYVFRRGADGKFKRIRKGHEDGLADRCWNQLRQASHVPASAMPAHLRLDIEGVKGKTFNLSLAGNYIGGGDGQVDFGPFKFMWSATDDVLRLVP